MSYTKRLAAAVVFDPFHIIQTCGREAVDRVKIDERLKAGVEQRWVIKGSRYLLLKNKDNLRSERNEPSELQRLLELNRRIEKVYILKDDLKQLWRYKSVPWAQGWFAGWYRRAIYSKIEPLSSPSFGQSPSAEGSLVLRLHRMLHLHVEDDHHDTCDETILSTGLPAGTARHGSYGCVFLANRNRTPADVRSIISGNPDL